jgi:hypothetical protein
MIYTSDKDKDFSTGIKSGDKRCFKCNGPVYFTSEHAETPSGKPTKNPLTGKVVPLDPSTHEYHECKPEDVEIYRETDEYKKRISEWISKQGSAQIIGSTSITKDTDVISSSHDTTNNNNSDNNLTLGKILASIGHTNAALEQMRTEFKADMAAIKNALSIDTDRSSSSEVQSAGDAL